MTTVQEMLQKKGQIVTQPEGRNLLGQNRSSASRFAMTEENIEDAAERTLERLLSNWSEEKEIQNRTFQSPEDYVNRVSKYWTSYNGLRTTLDATIVFVIGDTLESCRQRFFAEDAEEQKSHKRFKDYLESRIPFSVRQAYDFMAIGQRLSLFREKKLGMEQFRALLAVSRAGVDLANLPSTLETMSVKELLALKPKPQSSPKTSIVISNINMTLRKLENLVSEIYLTEIKDNLTEKQMEQIQNAHQKLSQIADVMERHLLNPSL